MSGNNVWDVSERIIEFIVSEAKLIEPDNYQKCVVSLLASLQVKFMIENYEDSSMIIKNLKDIYEIQNQEILEFFKDEK